MQIEYKDRRPETDHATRMKVRRARQLARKPGFSPVPNGKIMAQIATMQAILTTGYQQQVKDPEHPRDEMPSDSAIRKEAENAVARTLPQVPVGVRVRRQRGTGKTYG